LELVVKEKRGRPGKKRKITERKMPIKWEKEQGRQSLKTQGKKTIVSAWWSFRGKKGEGVARCDDKSVQEKGKGRHSGRLFRKKKAEKFW